MKFLIHLIAAISVGISSYSVQAQMVNQFSWANRHNKNYTTPVKDQKVQGPCHVFAATGALEAMYKLYFNTTSNIDLSEQYLYSQNAMPENNPQSTAIYYSYDVILDDGLMNESCYPYINEGIPSAPYWGTRNHCSNPSEVVNFGGYKVVSFTSNNDLKRKLIDNGPLALWFRDSDFHNNTAHAYTLIGWKVQNGNTLWQLQDSWPGDAKTSYVNIDLVDIMNSDANFKAFAIDLSQGPITSTSRSHRSCEDKDGDGYYNWGIGPKPGNCPSNAHNQMDGDDTNCNKGPLDQNGKAVSINGCPVINTNEITVTPNGRTRLCPNDYYTIRASAPGATQYQFTLSGTASIQWTGSNFINIRTPSNFGRAVVGVRAKNQAGWSNYKYEYFYREYSGCSSSYYRQAADTTQEGTNLKEQIKDSNFLSIYPVPASREIRIDAKFEINQITISDLNGSEVLNTENVVPNSPINVSHLDAGIYVVMISGSGHVLHKKLRISQ